MHVIIIGEVFVLNYESIVIPSWEGPTNGLTL